MRFWDVDHGKISISNTDIKELKTNNLRNLESFVTQETILFKDTIENNLKIANPNATKEQIIEACKKASLHDFINALPDGYETMVGELGDTLSGGERQRIGVARAFLHDAPLILLDEPTSNLDNLNEAIILKALKQQKDKTIVLVSHRPSTLCIADDVVQMKEGKIIYE
ncbi:putative ABC transporter ATP-binding protein [bioreactor metagenome]|uniref:Putative ABC transporter ATP-binding protein n=2 Tax=root TaxID=1 RepID=A0A645A3P9_9ZZZZ